MKKGTLIAIIWLVGLTYLFFTDRFWPWVLLLVALAIAVSGFIKDQPAKTPPSVPPQTPEPVRPPEPPVIQQAATPVPLVSEPVIPEALPVDLPAKCPACGAPLGGLYREEGWSSKQSYSCQYCGAHIPLKAQS